jgi:hypothetical protein
MAKATSILFVWFALTVIVTLAELPEIVAIANRLNLAGLGQ